MKAIMATFLALQLLGCAALEKVEILPPEARRAVSIARKAGEAIRSMSEEEEYYLGRAVAAMILGGYELYGNDRLQRYVNLVGQAVVMSSDRPYTHGGYHFAVLDTEEVNAFACPGGIIFITKGMLGNVENEEELAAVLAHEVAHVSLRHGVSAVKASRWADVVLALGAEAARRYTSSEVRKLVNLFEGSIDDVFKTIVVNGYGRDQEMAADEGSLLYLSGAGYNPEGLASFLNRLKASYGASKGGIFKTHPGTDARLENVRRVIEEKGWRGIESGVRTERFISAKRRL